MSLNKTNTVTELWQTTYNWLLLSGIQLNEKYCREEITTHPDYPALTAVSDFLEAGSMAYNAVQADASYINEFNYPVLAHIRKPGQEYLYLIANARKWDIEKEVTSHWSGIVLYPEKEATWFNENNSIAQKAAKKNQQYIAAFVFTGLCLFASVAYSFTNPAIVAFGLLSFIGVVISVFLLGAELGYQSQLVKQVCGAVSNGGCEKVLKSKYAKGLFGITPADAALLYFSTQFIIYLIGSLFPLLLQSVFLISTGGIVIASWSIYTQSIKLKQWCALCLGIVIVLVFQSFLLIFIFKNEYFNIDQFLPFSVFLMLILILLLFLLPIKELIKSSYNNNRNQTELKKWKRDTSLFIKQWENESVCDTTVFKNDLLIGNQDAPIRITVACNPYCTPCANTHHYLDDLMKKYKGSLSLQVRLLGDSNFENDEVTIATKAILQKAKTLKSNDELQEMLADWFMWMDISTWATKWKTVKNVDVKKEMQDHENWINNAVITYTPTIYINGKKLPGRYSIKDIETMIFQLEFSLVKI